MKRQPVLSIPSLMSLSFNMISGLDSRLTVAGIIKNGRKNMDMANFHCKKLYLPVHSKVVYDVFLLKKLVEYCIPLFSSWRSTRIRILRTQNSCFGKEN